MAECGDAVLVAGWIALEATALLARRKEEELQKRLPEGLIRKAAGFDNDAFLAELSAKNIQGILGTKKENGRVEIRGVLEGGIFHALWDLAEEGRRGLDLEVRSIPIRQETVEICEVFDLNPYQARSGGCCLIAASNGVMTLNRLRQAGIPAVCIGIVTKGPARILRNGEDIRYLDKPRYQDEILKMNFS